MKSKRVLLAILAFVFAFAMPLSALDKKDEEDGLLKVERPEKCPKIPDEKLEAARKNKAFKELIESHDGLMGLYKELEASKALAEGGDQKSQKTADKLEKRIMRERKAHEKIAEKLKKPWVQDYNKLQKKYNDLTKKGDAAAARKQDKAADKYYQQSQTFTGEMESLKTKIDYVDYYSFFEGYEKEEEEKDDKPLIQGDKPGDKKDKNNDAKKDKKKKKKSKDDNQD